MLSSKRTISIYIRWHREAIAENRGTPKNPKIPTIVSGETAIANGIPAQLNLHKRTVLVANLRNLSKRDLKLNDARPHMEVDPETYEVRADGELLTCDPATHLPMPQRYVLV